jgi:DNA repair protein RecO (recombination protein O)
MHTSRCEAILLSSMDYREADIIGTFFTLEHGKVRGLARGAKSSRKRFGGALESFAHLRLQMRLKEGLCFVAEADVISVFPGIRADLQKIAHAAYACEIAERFLPEGHELPRLFRLLLAYLRHLDAFPCTPSDRRFFETNLLNIVGYRLPLESCHVCGTGLADRERLFLAPAGALLCRSCSRGDRPVSGESVALLRRSMETGRFGTVLFAGPLLDDAGELLDRTIAAYLDRPLKSLAFLREMAGMPEP